MYMPVERADSAKGLTNWEPQPFKRFKVHELDLDSIVDRLAANKIYELPHQRELVPNAGYYHQYSVETKVDGIVRQCYFGNLREFTAKYPDIIEFKYYNAVVETFKEIWSQYQTTLEALKPR